MIYGYVRVSTKSQNIERQIRNISASYSDAHIVEEKFTGTKIDRPEWNKVFKAVKSGDTIVFDSVSRMSRNAEDGVEVYFDLYDRGVNLVFLKEPHINTDTYKTSVAQSIGLTGNEIADEYIKATNKVLKILAEKQIRLAFDQSEKEVNDMHQRIREGIVTYKLNGGQMGMSKGSTFTTKKGMEYKSQIKKNSKDFGGKLSDKELMELTKMSRNTFYKYKRELKQELESVYSATE